MLNEFKHTKSSLNKLNTARVKFACAKLLESHILILETDTITGASCLISPSNIKKLIKIKRRAGNKPFVIAAKYIEHFVEHIALDSLSQEELDLVHSISAHPTSYLVPVNKESYLSRFGDTVCIRIVKNGIIADITNKLSSPIITTSCNLEGEKPIIEPLLVSQAFEGLTLCGPYPTTKNIENNSPSKIYNLKSKKWIRT